MARTTPAEADPHGSDSPPPGDSSVPHPVLDHSKRFTKAAPDSSVGSVRKVARLDGRTRIVAGREPGGSWWRLRRRLRFTREHARELRDAGISEVVLKRGLRGASFPLAWLSNRQG